MRSNQLVQAFRDEYPSRDVHALLQWPAANVHDASQEFETNDEVGASRDCAVYGDDLRNIVIQFDGRGGDQFASRVCQGD